jgi:hypothetical protein
MCLKNGVCTLLELACTFCYSFGTFWGRGVGGGGGGGGNMGILYSLPSILALFAKHASKQAKVCKVGLDPFGSTPTQTMKSMVCRK